MATNLEFIKSASGTSVSSLDVTDCFSANYDVYQVHITDYINSDIENWLEMQFLDSGGTVISALEYDFAVQVEKSYAAFTEEKNTNQAKFSSVGYSIVSSIHTTSNTINIFNPYDSSSYTFAKWQTSAMTGSGVIGLKGIGVHKSAEQLSGIRFVAVGSNTINSIAVSIFGVK